MKSGTTGGGALTNQSGFAADDSDSGFSVLEVLVSLAILILSLGTVYQLYAGSLRSMAAVQRQLGALAVAQSRLAEAAGGLPIVARGATSDGYGWTLTSAPAVLPGQAAASQSPRSGPRWFTVTVTWVEQGKPRSLAFTTAVVVDTQ